MPAEAPPVNTEEVATPERSAAKPRDCVHLCVSFSRSFYSIRVLVRMRVWRSQLTLVLFFSLSLFNTYGFCGCDCELFPTAEATEHCVVYRAVEYAMYMRNLVLTICCCFCSVSFVFKFWCFEYRIYFDIASLGLSA